MKEKKDKKKYIFTKPYIYLTIFIYINLYTYKTLIIGLRGKRRLRRERRRGRRRRGRRRRRENIILMLGILYIENEKINRECIVNEKSIDESDVILTEAMNAIDSLKVKTWIVPSISNNSDRSGNKV